MALKIDNQQELILFPINYFDVLYPSAAGIGLVACLFHNVIKFRIRG
jgi:hypothetical protein